MAYSEKLLDHYENPRNIGTLDKNSSDVGTGLVGAPACGDVMKLQIKVSPEGIIEDAKFKTFGCGSAIASSSLVTEWVKGKTLDQAMGIKNTQIAEELGLVGAFALLALMAALVFRGLRIAILARDDFSSLLAVGLVTSIGLQTLIIVAGNAKLIPLTGITFPFVSYGGSSLLASFVVLGLLLAISHRSTVETDGTS